MNKQFFAFSYNEKIWYPIENPIAEVVNASDLPIVVLINSYDEVTGQAFLRAWCPTHNCYEDVLKYNHDSVTTTSGCHLAGFTALVTNNIYKDFDNPKLTAATAPYLWCLDEDNREHCYIFTCNYVDIIFQEQSEEGDHLPTPHFVYKNKFDIHVSYDAEKKHDYPAEVPYSVLKRFFPRLKEKFLDSAHSTSDYQKYEIEAESKNYTLTIMNGDKDRHYWETNINGFNFRQIHFIKVFQNISRTMECFWYEEEELRDKILFAIENNGRYTALIQIKDKYVVQFDHRDSGAPPLVFKQDIAFNYWLLQTGLKEMHPHTDKYNLPYSDPNMFFVKPVTKIHTWENLSIQDMLLIPVERITAGYYIYLYKKLNTINIMRHPRKDDVIDEFDYLKDLCPYAAPIFEAAKQNNPEAQYVMHLMYVDGFFFRGRDYSHGDVWYTRALKNNWLTNSLDKNIVNINNTKSFEEMYKFDF